MFAEKRLLSEVKIEIYKIMHRIKIVERENFSFLSQISRSWVSMEQAIVL